MAFRRLTPVIVLSLVLGGCAATPVDPPAADPVESGPVQVLDKARSVADDLEQRNLDIESQMPDPFSAP